MNGISQKVLVGIISSMFLIIMSLIAVAWGDVNADIENVQDTTKQIQAEYYRIAVLESQLTSLSKQVESLDSKLDTFLKDMDSE